MSGEIAKSGYDLDIMPASEFIQAAEALPTIEDAIEGILPVEEVMLMVGDPYQGKSIELQRLACAFGGGGTFHGLKLKKCTAFYITWEGATQGISNRFAKILQDFPQCQQPIIKLQSDPLPLNIEQGYTNFYYILSRAKEQYNIEVVLIDSFPYTFAGNPRQDEFINKWWIAIKKLSHELHLTFVVSWELSKIIFYGNEQQEMFSLQRVKTASTTAYKVNTVVAIGEEKKCKKIDGKAVWTPLGTRIVLLKAKDAKAAFEPLAVELNRDRLCWNGQHWQFDENEYKYMAVSDEVKL